MVYLGRQEGGANLKERIKALRVALGMNQTDFGAAIGVKQTTVAGYENGTRAPIDAVITSICREFNVSEHWLRTGDGEMMVKVDADQELQDIFAEITVADDDLIKRIIKTYWQLPENEKAVIRKLVDGLIEKNTPEK